ncbi:MAG: 3-deoxy-7-phosphoheptulonate synthase [Candidatus Heimdallarchaeota archaeon]|nr:3-deoxy-7-phosphoheptulonate synthase [Candidatus Heimdallarchaeota archaeon]
MTQEMKFSREYKSEDTVINVKGTKIGSNYFTVAAGPCAIESQEQYYETAKQVKAAGATIIRGSVFKPRTSPYSFQGLGRDGLKLIKDLSEDLEVVVETEVMDTRDVAFTANHVDILRVGARNMQNFSLLKELSKVDKPVMLKRGISATIDEWLFAAEYLMINGNEQVILCERGIRTFDKTLRNTMDLAVIPFLRKKTHLPIIVDPSHGTGQRELILPISKAAIALGSHGLLIEVHYRPEKAKCDGHQSLTPQQFAQLMTELKPYAKLENKMLGW